MKWIRIWVFGMALGVSAAYGQQDPIINGTFEDNPLTLQGWTAVGEVVLFAEPESPNHWALIEENPVDLGSIFEQQILIPEGASLLTFRFLLVPFPGCGDPTCCEPNCCDSSCASCDGSASATSASTSDPQILLSLGSVAASVTAPDAFLAFMLDPVTDARLVVPEGCAPNNLGYLWIDNDENTPPSFCSDPPLVTLTGGPPPRIHFVTFDISSLSGLDQTAVLKFGMVDGCDGFATRIFVDDVLIEFDNTEPVAVCRDITVPSDGGSS